MKNANLNKFSFLKTTLALAAAVCAFSIVAQQAFALSPLAPMTIQDGKLRDSYGKPFIFRGVTVEQNLAPEKALQAIRDAAALGANAVQVEINGNEYERERMITGEQLRAIIETCKTSRLICVLEPNDVAGYPDARGAGIPATAASFWSWPDIRSAIEGQQAHIILGFGNQYLSPMSPYEYMARMDTYLADFLQYPLNTFVIMIDGSGWGQDADNAMYEYAKTRASQARSLNLLYSVDMFDAYTNPENVRAYIESFSAIKAPLVIGGFAPTPYYHPHNVGPRPAVAYDLPENFVMQYAEQFGVGYFGWSWSGNTKSALDIVTGYNASTLTNWGNVLFNDANGIKTTAKRASIYDNISSSSSSTSSTSSMSSSSSSSSSVQTNRPPIAEFVASNYPAIFCGSPNAGQGKITARATGSYDPDGDQLTYFWNGSATASGETATFTSWSGYSYQITLTVIDSHGASASVVHSVSPFYLDCPFSSASSVSSSSSSIRSSLSSSSSSVKSSSRSSSSSRTSSSSSKTSSSSSVSNNGKAQCSYQIQSQWSNGFTAAIRVKNVSTQPISGWSVNWKYADNSKVTNLWNANLSGANPYTATNLNWNSTIQPGQLVEFGFQGSKPAGMAIAPVVTGNICQ